MGNHMFTMRRKTKDFLIYLSLFLLSVPAAAQITTDISSPDGTRRIGTGFKGIEKESAMIKYALFYSETATEHNYYLLIEASMLYSDTGYQLDNALNQIEYNLLKRYSFQEKDRMLFKTQDNNVIELVNSIDIDEDDMRIRSDGRKDYMSLGIASYVITEDQLNSLSLSKVSKIRIEHEFDGTKQFLDIEIKKNRFSTLLKKDWQDIEHVLGSHVGLYDNF